MGAGAFRRHAAILFGLLWTCSVTEISIQRATGNETSDNTAVKRLVADALRAEMTGDAPRRAELLDEAIGAAPSYAPARWQSGQVWVDGEWLPVDEAQQAAAADPKRAEYQRLRAAGDDTPNDQLALARWCRKNRLDDEASLHWARVLAHDPSNHEAQRALGVRWFRGRMMTFAEIDAAKGQVRAARAAAREFAPQVARWERLLSAGDLNSRDQALNEIRALREPGAIPALEKVTLDARLATNADFERAMRMGLALVEALDEQPEQAATDSLLRHATTSPIGSVRRDASDALKRRSPHGYVPQLIGRLTMPIESSYRLIADRDGSVQYWHSLFREGRDANWSIEGRSSLVQLDFNGSTWLLDDDQSVVGERRQSDAEVAAKKSTVATRTRGRYAVRAAKTEQQVARINQSIAAANSQVVAVLQQVTDEKFGNDPKAWWAWWDDYNEYYPEGATPVYERRYVDTRLEYHRAPQYAPARHSCFAAGTPVWTKTGLRAIESLKAGDFVLTQDLATGELDFRAVQRRTVRHARPTLTIRCGSESLQATLGHPVWVAGKGWKMAKELEVGDVLHGLRGPVLVDVVEPAEAIDVFNLVVEGAHNYFVGEEGVLVHDNSPREPTSVVVPGLVAK